MDSTEETGATIVPDGRGGVVATLGEDRLRLCLTLGALAQMEARLGVSGFEALAARLRAVSAGDLWTVMEALLAGGGLTEVQIRAMKPTLLALGFVPVARAVGAALMAAGTHGLAAETDTEGRS
ncbi:MAG: GTA-gp10 family protein [Asticcacaulis sp.]